MSERLTTRIVLEDITDLLTSELPQQLHISSADLAVLDRERETYVLVSDAGQLFLPEASPIVSELQIQKYVLRLRAPAETTRTTQLFLDRNDIELCIPLVVGERTIGFYLLGGKLSGNAYTVEEIQLLRLLGKQEWQWKTAAYSGQNLSRESLHRPLSRHRELSAVRSISTNSSIAS